MNIEIINGEPQVLNARKEVGHGIPGERYVDVALAEFLERHPEYNNVGDISSLKTMLELAFIEANAQSGRPVTEAETQGDRYSIQPTEDGKWMLEVKNHLGEVLNTYGPFKSREAAQTEIFIQMLPKLVTGDQNQLEMLRQ